MVRMRTKPDKPYARFHLQREAVARAKYEFQEAARAAFRTAADAFFAAHPEVTSFSWKQYHSEHNREYNHPFACLYDNCPLTFTEGDKNLKFTHVGDVVEVMSDPEDEFWDGYETAVKDPGRVLYGKACMLSDEVRKLVRGFEEDELEVMFGDPVEVIVTPNNFEVKEYWDFE